MKKTLCIILALIMTATVTVTGFAANEDAVLKFDENGDFTILHLTDWHSAYPMPEIHKQYAKEALAASDPDLVVLGGDMSEASTEDYPAAVKEICDLFIEAETPFVITFGNHDYLHDISIDDMFALYKQYGGEYCLSEDENPELFGCGTCSLSVYSHDSSRVAYEIYCFDSGCEVEGKGYESVHPDQIEWYQNKAEELKNANNGEYVPSVVFQHIIVQEIFDKLFPVAKENDTKNIEAFDGIAYKMKAIPNLSNIKDGYIMEKPCPGYYNYGQLDAMSENGDVRAMFFGHDHSNSFTVEIDGIDIVNTPSVKPHSTLKIINWGGRVITLHEDGTYESDVLEGYELAGEKGSEIIDVGGVSWFEIIFTKIWKAFIKVSLVFWNFNTKVFYNF
jgi:predicted phosphodiesterase